MKIVYVALFAVAIFLLWEYLAPKREFPAGLRLQSYLTDGIIVITNNIFLYLIGVSHLYVLSAEVSGLSFLSSLDYGNPIVIVGVLILLDFLTYIWHVLNHKVSFLWMFHKAHHTEIYLNTLSGVRFHFGELLFSLVFKSVVYVLLLGVPFSMILLSEGITVIFSLFHHSNIAFRGERILSLFVIVPYLHQFHHSLTKKDHDNNYGVIFSWWDRLLGTLVDKENKRIGLGTVPYQNFPTFLRYGFQYRDDVHY